jgi:excisionase family DNA binding protein
MSIELPAQSELLTIREAALLLNISVTSMRRLQQGRHIAFIKIRGSVRFDKKDIASYVERNRQRVRSID